MLANGIRNVWSYAVIHCGHLTQATMTFTEKDLENETRGAFYLRQLLGSSNFEAGPILGALSGHLSHQIEHHMFPDIPAWRYREMSSGGPPHLREARPAVQQRKLCQAVRQRGQGAVQVRPAERAE